MTETLKSLIHDDIHCRNFSGLSQMPGKLAKMDIFRDFFFIYERTADKILFLHFLWRCSKRKVLSERHLLTQSALHSFMRTIEDLGFWTLTGGLLPSSNPIFAGGP
jgi:hypothetical protein